MVLSKPETASFSGFICFGYENRGKIQRFLSVNEVGEKFMFQAIKLREFNLNAFSYKKAQWYKHFCTFEIWVHSDSRQTRRLVGDELYFYKQAIF